MIERRYQLELAFRYLSVSGIADKIISTNKDFELEYRKMPLEGSTRKHKDFRFRGKSPNYYRFVEDHIRIVIELVEDNYTNGSITFHSKYMSMDRAAVDKFKKGWPVLAQQVKNSSKN